MKSILLAVLLFSGYSMPGDHSARPEVIKISPEAKLTVYDESVNNDPLGKIIALTLTAQNGTPYKQFDLNIATDCDGGKIFLSGSYSVRVADLYRHNKSLQRISRFLYAPVYGRYLRAAFKKLNLPDRSDDPISAKTHECGYSYYIDDNTHQGSGEWSCFTIKNFISNEYSVSITPVPQRESYDFAKQFESSKIFVDQLKGGRTLRLEITSPDGVFDGRFDLSSMEPGRKKIEAICR